MRTIAVVNQKGGCGKTTTAINLAASLADLGRRVLLVDMDPQGHTTLGLSIRSDQVRRGIYDVLLGEWGEKGCQLSEVVLTLNGNLHLAPSNIMLSAIEQQLAGIDGREDRLREALREVAASYDYCVIDSPPSVGLLTFNALRAADEILVPVETGFFSMHGLTQLLETVTVVNSEYGQDAAVRVLPTMYQSRHRIDREVLAEIRRHFGERLTGTIVRMNVRLREAASFGLPVGEFDPNSLGAKDYLALAAEFALREEGGEVPAFSLVRPEAEQPEAAEPAPASEGDVSAVETGETTPAAAEASTEQAVAAVATTDVPADTDVTPTQWTVVHPQVAEREASAQTSLEPSGTAVVFTLHAPDAGVVQVAGDFNDWTPEILARDDPIKGVWKRVMSLKSGRYRYRFVVDDAWGQDPSNPNVEDCPFGGYNSVVTVA